MSKHLSVRKIVVLGVMAAAGLIAAPLVTASNPPGTVFAQVTAAAASKAVASPPVVFGLSGGTGALSQFDGAVTTCTTSKDTFTLPSALAGPASAGTPFAIKAPKFSGCMVHLSPTLAVPASIKTSGGWTATYGDGDTGGSDGETLGAASGDTITIHGAAAALTAVVTLPKGPVATALAGCYLQSEAGSVEGAYNDSTGVLTIAAATGLDNTFKLDLTQNPAKAALAVPVLCPGSTVAVPAVIGSATTAFTGVYNLNPVISDS